MFNRGRGNEVDGCIYVTGLMLYACVIQFAKAKDDIDQGYYLGGVLRVASFLGGSTGAGLLMAKKAYFPIVEAITEHQEDGSDNVETLITGHLTAITASAAAILVSGNASAEVVGFTANRMQDGLSSCFSFFKPKSEALVELQAVLIDEEPVSIECPAPGGPVIAL